MGPRRALPAVQERQRVNDDGTTMREDKTKLRAAKGISGEAFQGRRRCNPFVVTATRTNRRHLMLARARRRAGLEHHFILVLGRATDLSQLTLLMGTAAASAGLRIVARHRRRGFAAVAIQPCAALALTGLTRPAMQHRARHHREESVVPG